MSRHETVKLNSNNGFCGVYILIQKGQTIWVGSSRNIFARIASHRQKSFDEVHIIWTTPQDRWFIESELISKLKPKINLLKNSLLSKSRSVDWASLRNSDIARMANCSREFVRQMRSKLGKPEARHKWQSSQFLNFKTQLSKKKRVKMGECLRFCKCEHTARLWCKKLKIKIIDDFKSRSPYEIINWVLPNNALSEIYSLKPSAISNQRKARGFGLAGLDSRKQSKRNLSVLNSLIEKETKKFKRWNASPVLR